MSSNFICLHPDTVEDVIVELLSNDFINQDNLKQLKNDSQKSIDPNILMDIRHNKVNPFPSGETNIIKASFKRNSEDTSLNYKPKIKDLKRIDKEISVTKSNLVAFQEQLIKKEERLKNEITQIESNIQKRSSPTTLGLFDEDESKHYFNLHLDRLENSTLFSRSKQKEKTWKPFEPQTFPIINVIATKKVIDDEPTTVDFNEEELLIFKICTGIDHDVAKPLECCSVDQLGKLRVAPIDSSSTGISTEKPPCHGNKGNILKTTHISKKVIKSWKLYVKRNSIKRLLLKRECKFKINLMRKYFHFWVNYIKILHINRGKSIQQTTLEGTEKNTRISINEFRKKSKHKIMNIHSQILDCSFINVPTFINCHIQQNITITTSNNQTISKLNNRPTHLNNNLKQTHVEESRMHVKVIKPEDVGLVQRVTNTRTGSTNNPEISISGKESAPRRMSNTNIKHFSHKYAAQQKVIAQQLAIIEEHQVLIANLKAQQLETKSQLSLKKAEYQLHNAVSNLDKRFQPEVKMIKASCNNFTKEVNTMCNLKNIDNSEKLTKSLFERQEYCKQLAEQTKMRKSRIEEQQAKFKMDEEEKLNKIKVEQKLQIKKNKIIAEDNARRALETKQRITQLNTLAESHYKHKLCVKYFNVFKIVLLKICHRIDFCNSLFEQKLLKKVFKHWQSKINLNIKLNLDLAQRHFHTRLLGSRWHAWKMIHNEYKLKVQVSEDMYDLKLQKRMIKNWIAFCSQQYFQNTCMMELAGRLHRKHVLKHTFDHWKQLPRVMFIENKKEQQRRAWRQAIQELIPDFSPIFAENINLD